MTTAPGGIPTPASIQGGRVVRLLARHRTWTSAPMSPDGAENRAANLRRAVADAGDGPGLIPFRCGDGREVDIRAREIVAIEHQACTEAPRPASEQRYRPVVPEPRALTAEEIAESVVRS